MRGEINQDCLPDVLRQLYIERRSGCLRLTQDHTRKEIFFELGAMIFASSNRREDRIGESMLRHGTITQEQFDLAQAQMGRGKRFGKILVDLKIISERDLIANVTFQVLDIIYSVFNWTTGRYEFFEVDKSISDDLKLELSTASIILEGVRRISDMDVIERGLGDLNRLIGPCTNPLLRLQTLSLRPLERQIIDVVREPVSLIKLLVKIKSPAETVLRTLYGLLSAGVLERFAPAELSQESGKMEVPKKVVRQTLGLGESVPVVLARQTGAHKVDEMALRRRIDVIKSRINDGDIYQLFSISTSSTLEELQGNYYKLAREFHPDRHLSASKEMRAEIDELFTQLTGLYDHARSILLPDPNNMPMPTGVTGSIKRNTEPQPLEGLPPVPPQTSSHKRPSVGKTGSQPLGIIPQVSESQNFEPINATTKEDEVLEEDISIPTITPPPIPQTPMDVIKLPARTSSRKASEERFKQTMLDAPAITGSIEVLDSNAPTEALVNTSETEALMEALDVMSNIPSHLEEPTSYSGATEPLMMQEDMELPNELENLQGFQPVANQTGIMSDNTGLMSEAVSTSVLDNLSTEEVMSNLTDLVEGFTTPLSVEDAQPIIDEEQAEQLFVAGRNHFQSRDVAGAVRSLREAVRLAPRQTRYRLLLGHVLSNNQRWQKEAEEQFRQVLDIEPVNVMAHLGLAQLYSKVGLVRRAENEYREALKIEPQNPVAKKGLKAIIGEDTLGIPIFLSKLLPNSTR